MSRQSLTGVIEVGGPRGLDVPQDAHHPLSIVLGDSLALDVTMLNSLGVPLDLRASTRHVVMTIKVRPSDFVAVLQQTATKTPSDGPNRCTFSFSEDDLFCLAQPRYVYDIWVIDDDGDDPPAVVQRQVAVPLSLFRVEGAATT